MKPTYTKEQIEDYEFWECMAITIERAKTLPDFWPVKWTQSISAINACSGLCDVVKSSYAAGIITLGQAFRFQALVRRIPFSMRAKPFESAYFWPPGEYKVRASACHWLAQQALRYPIIK